MGGDFSWLKPNFILLFKKMNEEQQKKYNAEFISEVFKPLVFVAFVTAMFAILLDYSFQLIEAIDILTL